jgi:hypothetical protein
VEANIIGKQLELAGKESDVRMDAMFVGGRQ